VFHISYSMFDIPYVIAGTARRVAMEYGIWNMEYGIRTCFIISARSPMFSAIRFRSSERESRARRFRQADRNGLSPVKPAAIIQ
jgi:hypothetical protein